MNFRDRSTGEYPISLLQVRRRAENIAFGDEPSSQVLDAADVDLVESITPPIAPEGKMVREVDPILVNGRWEQDWIIEDLPPPPIPDEVSAAQAQEALYNAGLLEQVEEEIGNHPYPKIRIWFRSATKWRRDNPYVMGMAVQLGLTDEQVEQLFVAASKIET